MKQNKLKRFFTNLASNLCAYINNANDIAVNYKTRDEETVKIHPYHHDVKAKNILADEFSNGYKPANEDSIHIHDGTLINLGIADSQLEMRDLKSRNILYSQNRKGHSLTTKLTGNDISIGDHWTFIEPRFDMTNVQPGELYMPEGMRDLKPRNILYSQNQKGHSINAIFTGNDQLIFGDLKFIEPQFVKIDVKPGEIYKKSIKTSIHFGTSHIPEPLESRTQYLARRAADPYPLKINVGDFGSEKGKMYIHKREDILGFGMYNCTYMESTIGRGNSVYFKLETDFEKVFDYKNKPIIAVQMTKTTLSPVPKHYTYTVVPGEVLQFKYDRIGDTKSVPISEVKPITSKEDQKEIEQILRDHKFQGHINFW